jgi:DnaJ-related protein SCJ1
VLALGVALLAASSWFAAPRLQGRRPDIGAWREEASQPKVEDAHVRVAVSLEALFRGETVSVPFAAKQSLCPACGGEGGHGVGACPICQGRGVAIVEQSVGHARFVTQQTCPRCRGSGRIVEHVCEACRGARVVRADATLRVKLSPELEEGSLVRLEGVGHQMPGAVPGDVVAHVHVLQHSVFERRGRHLYATLRLSLLEALLGFRKSLRHLDGSDIAVERQATVTGPDFVLELAGRGMPYADGAGSLFVSFRVQFPARLSKDDRLRVRELLGAND